MFVYTYVLFSGFPTKIVDIYEFVIVQKRVKCPSFFHPSNGWWGEQITKILIISEFYTPTYALLYTYNKILV